MPLYRCDRCNAVDNTALSITTDKMGYWGNRANPLCTECLTGKWHGKFPKEEYKEGDDVINP